MQHSVPSVVHLTDICIIAVYVREIACIIYAALFILCFCRYCFLEFQTPREAEEAVATTSGYKLDKQHTFAVNPFSDFDK